MSTHQTKSRGSKSAAAEYIQEAAPAPDLSDILGDIIASVPEAPDAAGDDDDGFCVEALVGDFHLGGDEMPVIVASAAPLLNLAHVLRNSAEEPQIERLRRTAIEAIGRYERDLAGARVSPERARAAHYLICATVDDVVLSKPWGVRNGWAQSNLVSTFHIDVSGGERVFELLDHFHQSPGANKDLLLLFYLCLSLAFEGRTRVSPRGALELSRIRDSLYRTLIGQYGTFERELSPHWRGVAARHEPLRTAAALWTLLSLVALLLALGYLFFTLALNEASDGTFAKLASLPPDEVPSIRALDHTPQPLRPPPPPPRPVVEEKHRKPPEPAPDPLDPLENFLAFLRPEVESGQVTLFNVDAGVLVRINNAGLFDVGSAEVSDRFVDLLERIGAALAAEKFRALVVGYTDNVPIRTIQFPSNWHLSEARAKAVGGILAAYTGPQAILTEGRAESDPVAGNDTPEGRARNRRTEILVLTNPETSLKTLKNAWILQGEASAAPGAPAGPQEDGAPQ